jgi:hypothetical protein
VARESKMPCISRQACCSKPMKSMGFFSR